jgi:predicted MPP superfamily phosphohydrolase
MQSNSPVEQTEDIQPPSPPKANSRFTMTRRRWLQLGFTGGLTTFASAAWGHYVEPERLGVTQLDLPVANWPGDEPPLRIGHASDFHCDDAKSTARVIQAIDLLMAQKPDVVFLTGDFVTNDYDRWSEVAADAVKKAAEAPHGAYAVLGNHDGIGLKARRITLDLEQNGIRVLRNRSVRIPDRKNVWLTGLASRSMWESDAAQALNRVPANATKVLLVHEPDYADESPKGFCAQFSGHSHGGQICIPVIGSLHTPRYARRYIEGLLQGPHHPLFVTRGIGVVGPRFRFCCPPEVAVITLRGK